MSITIFIRVRFINYIELIGDGAMKMDFREIYSAEVDLKKRIVFVTLAAEFTIEQSYEAIKDFWTKMAAVGREAFVVCDITRFKSGSRGARVMLQKVMRLVESYEPTAVVRIIDNYTGAMCFDRAYSSLDVKYSVYRVSDKTEAMEIVQNLSRNVPVFRTPPSLN